MSKGNQRMESPANAHDVFEFGGRIGALGITVAVPYFSYFFSQGCSEAGCPPLPFGRFMVDGLQKYTTLDGWLSLWDFDAALVYAGWYAFCVACYFIVPGTWIKGSKLRDGTQLEYKINAFNSWILTAILMASAVAIYGTRVFDFVWDHWTGLVTAALLNSVAQAFFVYAMSYQGKRMLAEHGNTSSPFYNWFIGRELNPRVGSLDIKYFNELRPGIILWFIIDIALALKQYNDLGRITDSMSLVVAFHTIYIVDSLWNEAAILTTMDITTDGFGFMLSVGDLLWVPFTYSLQARYLAAHPKDLGLFGVLAVLAVQAAGYYIFRISNLEKNDFRNGRNPRNLTSMETKRGTRLLTSGWWGLSRHPNYLGDWIMAWAWCLPTGFTTPLTYYYVVYFAILLVHRQMRDDEACKRKYGSDWDKYCKLVPSKIVPGLY